VYLLPTIVDGIEQYLFAAAGQAWSQFVDKAVSRNGEQKKEVKPNRLNLLIIFW